VKSAFITLLSVRAVTDFIFTIATTGANEVFSIPCSDVGTFNATVDWGDGTTSLITTYNDSDLTHTYANAGDHQIKISGSFPSVRFVADNTSGQKVKSVENLGVVGWLLLEYAFQNCVNMTSFRAGKTDTSNVTSMASLFFNCSSLTHFDTAGFDTSSALDFSYMFYGTGLTSLNVSGFDTTRGLSMMLMFSGNLGTSAPSSLTDIVGVENFNIEALHSGPPTANDGNALRHFASLGTLPTYRYDSLLINWAAQNPASGFSPNFGSSKYTAGGAAAAARAKLINTNSWTILDGGTV
jgi:hypothetical protein